MKHAAFFTGIVLSASLSGPGAGAEKTILFSGYEWKVKNSAGMGPGPNAWDENNVWVDEQGRLHLKISQQNGKWHCAELISKERFGFGRYQWQLVGRPDKFDPQIVLGLFPYTVPEVGPDGTNEIDIEFARWGKAEWPIGNFTVCPPSKKPNKKRTASILNLTAITPRIASIGRRRVLNSGCWAAIATTIKISSPTGITDPKNQNNPFRKTLCPYI